MPLALCLAFRRNKGVYGLWLGFTIATIILNLGYFMIIECSNWSKISERIQKKIDKEKVKNITDSLKQGKRLKDTEYAGRSAATEPAKQF